MPLLSLLIPPPNLPTPHPPKKIALVNDMHRRTKLPCHASAAVFVACLPSPCSCPPGPPSFKPGQRHAPAHQVAVPRERGHLSTARRGSAGQDARGADGTGGHAL
eukprot:286107-Chlamydomonas_euryale.AAC.2